jgi:hypothetical protein
MNQKTQKILTWGVGITLLAFVGRVVYKTIQRKRMGLTSDSKKAKQLNEEMEALIEKIKKAPK